jgi:hypothetical protein
MAIQLVAIVNRATQVISVKAVRAASMEDPKSKEKFANHVSVVETSIHQFLAHVTVSRENVFIVSTTHSELLVIYVLLDIMVTQFY